MWRETQLRFRSVQALRFSWANSASYCSSSWRRAAFRCSPLSGPPLCAGGGDGLTAAIRMQLPAQRLDKCLMRAFFHAGILISIIGMLPVTPRRDFLRPRRFRRP